jgi:hypothetical protein
MAASFLASFFSFLIVGIFVFWTCSLEFTETLFIRAVVFITLLANGCYYFYCAAFSEMNEDVCAKLRTIGPAEWFVRVANQTILFSLWFLLGFGWAPFGIGLVVLYLTYIAWDVLTWKCFNKHPVLGLDVFGLVVTLVFVGIGQFYEPAKAANQQLNLLFGLGGLCILYLVLCGLGVAVCRFNPLSRKYTARNKLR